MVYVRLVTFKKQFNNVAKKTNYGSCTINIFRKSSVGKDAQDSG